MKGFVVMATKSADSVSRQNAARRRVREALDRHKLVVSRTRYRNGKLSALVLMDGQYFDVNEWELGLLKGGATPSELGLFPVLEDGT